MSSNLPNSKNLQNSIENIMKKAQYENFDEWVSNFSLNLPNIWNEKSAKELFPSNLDSYQQEIHSAIVIGRGPSINKHEHLKLLASSNFQGTIVCCDGKLSDALYAGVTPDKFPNFYVTTIDPYLRTKKHYDHEIISSYGSKIKGIFSIVTHPDVVDSARKSDIEIFWLHSLLDYNEGKKSFNNISSLMIRSKNSDHRLPAIQTGGNIGTASWFIAWQILKCSQIALIGINHGWEEDDPWEKIIFHGESNKEISEGVDRNSPVFKKLFKKIYNADFDCNCIVDPLFQFYSEALKEFILRSPNWVTTINATEGGSIFGQRITSMKFNDFLDQYKF